MPAGLCVPEALDASRLDALTLALRGAATDKAIRVIVLRGHEDGVFCLGMDFALAGEKANDGLSAMARCLHTLRASPKCTMAVVDGRALGGGVGLAAACDYVLATERATFGLPELLVGLVPAMIFPILLERMTAQQVRRLALLGHAHSAAEASTMGLVDKVITSDPGRLERAVQRTVRRLSRADGAAAATLRQLSTHTDPEAAIDRGVALTDALLRSSAVQSKLRNFAADQEAVWL